MLLAANGIERAEGRGRPGGERAQRLLLGRLRQGGEAGAGAMAIEEATRRALGAPGRDRDGPAGGGRGERALDILARVARIDRDAALGKQLREALLHAPVDAVGGR